MMREARNYCSVPRVRPDDVSGIPIVNNASSFETSPQLRWGELIVVIIAHHRRPGLGSRQRQGTTTPTTENVIFLG
jgi:hypothetical protein